MSTLRKFIVLAGTHYDPKTREHYKVGQTVVSDKPLATLFTGKFRDDGDATSAEQKAAKAAAEKPKLAVSTDVAPAAPAAEEAPAATEFKSDLGEDCTDAFEDTPKGYRVVKKGKNYFVVTEEKPNETAYEGGAALTTAAKVKSFLASIEE